MGPAQQLLQLVEGLMLADVVVQLVLNLLRPSHAHILAHRFYFAINIGSLVATLVVVPVQENKG